MLKKVLFFSHRGHLQALKVCDLKRFMSESIVRFKRLKSEVKFKNMIGEVTKNFRIYLLAVWRSIQNFYSNFTKVTCKCECFGRSVHPCYSKVAVKTQDNNTLLNFQYLYMLACGCDDQKIHIFINNA